MFWRRDRSSVGVMEQSREAFVPALRWGEPSLDGTMSDDRFSLPVGTVTFLLTDIEGSSRMWEQDSEAAAKAVARHYAILDEAIGRHGGVRPLEQGEGDSVVAAFSRASDAAAAALGAQLAIRNEGWPEGGAVKVRMALHTGEAQLRDEANYFGRTIIRCARLRAIGHGGQVLLSGATHDLVIERLPEGASVVDLGSHRLRDLGRPEHVYELRHSGDEEEFPPLRSLEFIPNNLPVQLSTFIGRADDLAAVGELLSSTRLVTITGAGGAGKTRLALQTAAEVLDEHPDGVWWVDLAPVRD